MFFEKVAKQCPLNESQQDNNDGDADVNFYTAPHMQEAVECHLGARSEL